MGNRSITMNLAKELWLESQQLYIMAPRCWASRGDAVAIHPFFTS